MDQTPKLFLSTMLYAASKRLGYEQATRELLRQVGSVDTHEAVPSIPAALTLAYAAALEPAQLNVNAGATVIGKARSLAAHEFLASSADVWLSCDDDVCVSANAVAALVSQARAERCLVVVPCLLRNTTASGGVPTVNVVAPFVAVRERAPSGGELESIEAGGFGCFAISRAVVEALHKEAGTHNDFRHDGRLVRALFRDQIIEQEWVTEDLATCRRARALGFTCWAVRCGHSIHAGQRLDCATLEALQLRAE